MAVNFTRIGNEFQANDVLANDQEDPDMAALTDGRFGVAYEHEVSGPDLDIWFQFLNSDGTRSGSGLQIDQDSGFQVDPVVAPRLGGGAVIVWHDSDGFHAGNPVTDIIELRVVSATGALSDKLSVSGESDSPNRAPDAAMLADGRVIVVWQTDFPSESDVLFRVLGADGVTLGATGFVDNSGQDTDAASIAASGNKALIAYAEEAA